MLVKFYLTVNDNGTVKTTKTRPNLQFNEVAIAMQLDIPNTLFQKPQLSASITIPPEAVMPREINADVVNNVKEAIEQAAGMEVKLIVENLTE